MKPLLAHVYEPHRVTFPCYVQPKLNGVRALYQQGCFQSREGLPFAKGLLDHLAELLLKTFGPEIILDGELYVHGWSLPRILGAITPVRQEQKEDTRLVEYHVFDSVDFRKSWEDRWNDQVGKLWLLDKGPIKWVENHRPENEGEANLLYSGFVTLGYEGMMYRLGDCPYTVPKEPVTPRKMLGLEHLVTPRLKHMSDKDNRVWHMLKRKNWQDAEFRCISLRETWGEQGERGFIMTVASGQPAPYDTFDLGSGLTDQEVEHYLQNPPIDRLIKVKYLVLSPYGIPLNATILAVL